MAVTSWVRRQFKDGVTATATLASTMSNVATTATLASGTGTSFPDGSVGPFIVTIDQGNSTEEKVLIQSRSGDVLTVASSGRGYNGTTAVQHSAQASVLHTIDAQDLDEANQVAVQTLGAVAASGDLLVGSGANTLAKLAKGATNAFLQVTGASLGWTGFGVGQSTVSAVGDAAADGTQTTPARSDHKHGREAYGTPGSSAVGDSAAAGSATTDARSDHVHGREAFASPVSTGTANAAGSATTIPHSDHVHQGGSAMSLTGATSATRYVGATTSGAPASGTFAVGDFVIDQTGIIWICTSAGTPGTWKAVPRPVVLRVHRASAYTAVNGTATFPFDTVDEDTDSGWNNSSHLYTVPVAGLYLVDAGLTVNTASGNQFAGDILKNGSGAKHLWDTIAGGVEGQSSAALIRCAVNDTLGLQYTALTSNGFVVTSAAYCYMDISRVGG